MIDKTILAATCASSNNVAALAALGLLEFALAEPSRARARGELNELIDKWGQTLLGVDPLVVANLSAELKAAVASSDFLGGPLKQAS